MSSGAENTQSSPQSPHSRRQPPPPPPARRPGRAAPSLPTSPILPVPNQSIADPTSVPPVAGLASVQSPRPPSVFRYLMNDIPRGTSLPKLIKCLQPTGYGQNSTTSTLHDVQVGIAIKSSRLDDELSVATIEFRDNPTWLSEDACGFPKFLSLGTLWQAVEWNAVDEDGRTEFIRAVMKHDGGNRMSLYYAEMLAEFNETDVNIQDNKRRTALHWACAESRLDMTMLCLSVPECQIGLKDDDGLTAFDISLQNAGVNESIPTLFYSSMFDLHDVEPQAALLRSLTISSVPMVSDVLFPGAAMFLPIEVGNETLVEALINRGVDLTARNKHGDTALHVAAAKVNNVAITTRLLNAGSDVNAIGNRGSTPLHCAVQSADGNMVQLLLHHDADQSVKDLSARTALHLAEEDRKQDLVFMLKGDTTNSRVQLDPPVVPSAEVQVPLSEGLMLLPGDQLIVFDLSASKDSAEVPLTEAEREKASKMSLHQASESGALDVVRIHLRLGTDLEEKFGEGKTPLHLAAENGHAEIVQTLLDGGANIEAVGEWNYTPLLTAAGSGKVQVVAILLASGANIEALSEFNWTALHLAAGNGYLETVRSLITGGANIAVLSLSNKTALHVAAENGHAETVKSLITSGANIEALSLWKQTALHIAAENGHAEPVKSLITSGANIEALSTLDKTALHIAAENGHAETVKSLITSGANIEALSTSNKTALHIAAENGHAETVKSLITSGVNIEALSTSNKTALHLAAENGHADIVKSLIAGGISEPNETPLHMAARFGDLKVVKILLTTGANIVALSMSNETALHTAAKNGHTVIVKALLTSGANTEDLSGSDQTALHIAAENGHAETVKSLITSGANIEALSTSNKTALHIAAENGYDETVKSLITGGANIEALSESNQTALQLAMQNGHRPAVKALRAAGAHSSPGDHYRYAVLGLSGTRK